MSKHVQDKLHECWVRSRGVRMTTEERERVTPAGKRLC